MSETKLTVTIDNGKPVELIDFTASFYSLAQEYKKHSHSHFSANSALYIKEVRQGSIIVELIEFTKTSVIPFFSDTNTVVEFATALKTGYEWFKGKTKGKEQPKYDISELENLKRILDPVAKNTTETTINFNVTVNGSVVQNFGSSNEEANAIQNRILEEIRALKETSPSQKEKVVFYWYQAKNDLKSIGGERGVIESIYKNHVKVIFESEEIKHALIHPPNKNMFDISFIVDVDIETVNYKPVLYKIKAFHGYIDNDTQSKLDM